MILSQLASFSNWSWIKTSSESWIITKNVLLAQIGWNLPIFAWNLLPSFGWNVLPCFDFPFPIWVCISFIALGSNWPLYIGPLGVYFFFHTQFLAVGLLGAFAVGFACCYCLKLVAVRHYLSHDAAQKIAPCLRCVVPFGHNIPLVVTLWCAFVAAPYRARCCCLVWVVAAWSLLQCVTFTVWGCAKDCNKFMLCSAFLSQFSSMVTRASPKISRVLCESELEALKRTKNFFFSN